MPPRSVNNAQPGHGYAECACTKIHVFLGFVHFRLAGTNVECRRSRCCCHVLLLPRLFHGYRTGLLCIPSSPAYFLRISAYSCVFLRIFLTAVVNFLICHCHAIPRFTLHTTHIHGLNHPCQLPHLIHLPTSATFLCRLLSVIFTPSHGLVRTYAVANCSRPPAPFQSHCSQSNSIPSRSDAYPIRHHVNSIPLL